MTHYSKEEFEMLIQMLGNSQHFVDDMKESLSADDPWSNWWGKNKDIHRHSSNIEMYDRPLSEMPLYINDSYYKQPKAPSALAIIARWRLKVGR